MTVVAYCENLVQYAPPDGCFGIRFCTKFNLGLGFALDVAGGAYDTPPEPIVGWGGGYPSHSIPLDAFSVSFSTSSVSNPRCL